MKGFSVVNLVNYIYLLARASLYFWLLTIKFGLVRGTLMVQYFLQSKDRDNYSFVTIVATMPDNKLISKHNSLTFLFLVNLVSFILIHFLNLSQQALFLGVIAVVNAGICLMILLYVTNLWQMMDKSNDYQETTDDFSKIKSLIANRKAQILLSLIWLILAILIAKLNLFLFITLVPGFVLDWQLRTSRKKMIR